MHLREIFQRETRALERQLTGLLADLRNNFSEIASMFLNSSEDITRWRNEYDAGLSADYELNSFKKYAREICSSYVDKMFLVRKF